MPEEMDVTEEMVFKVLKVFREFKDLKVFKVQLVLLVLLVLKVLQDTADVQTNLHHATVVLTHQVHAAMIPMNHAADAVTIAHQVPKALSVP